MLSAPICHAIDMVAASHKVWMHFSFLDDREVRMFGRASQLDDFIEKPQEKMVRLTPNPRRAWKSAERPQKSTVENAAPCLSPSDIRYVRPRFRTEVGPCWEQSRIAMPLPLSELYLWVRGILVKPKQLPASETGQAEADDESPVRFVPKPRVVRAALCLVSCTSEKTSSSVEDIHRHSSLCRPAAKTVLRTVPSAVGARSNIACRRPQREPVQRHLPTPASIAALLNLRGESDQQKMCALNLHRQLR